jgi:hypothetical protein
VDDVLNECASDKKQGALARAKAWLAEFLADGEPVLIEDILRAAGHHLPDVSDRTIRSAKRELHIINHRLGKNGNDGVRN